MGATHRKECPFCGGDDNKRVPVNLYSKVGVKVMPGSCVMECAACCGQYTDVVPDDGDFVKSYTKDYTKQVRGLVRFQKTFGDDVTFDEDHPVLEVGGGEVGVQSICSKYLSVDLRGDVTFRKQFEDLEDGDIMLCKDEGVNTIVTCDCIEHVLHPARFFEMAARVLPSGGKMYMQSGESKPYGKPYGANKRQAAHINCPSDESVRVMCGDRFDWIGGDCEGDWAWIFERTSD